MIDAEEHRVEVEAWREGRYRLLRRDTGWLTLAGLGWLSPGANRVGSDAEADVVLPAGPQDAGIITVTENAAIAEGDWLHAGQPIGVLPLMTDAAGEPTLLEMGDLRLCLIERGGRLAVRTWDTSSPRRRDFAGIDHWPVDPRWRLEARLVPTPERKLEVPDVLGIVETEVSPADVVFEVRGEVHSLQALVGGDDGSLWIVFGDTTNGVETYGGGRFVYTAPPVGDSVVIDFNRAYNPPCVFSPFATCPLPWEANRLPIRVDAGERFPIA